MSQINHVAIIMDGNGRWANERRRPRVWGHVRGSRVVSDIVETAVNLNLGALTLYAFSTENWKRPPAEIDTLFRLLKKFLVRERTRILKNNIRFKMIGDISSLNEETKSIILDIEKKSSDNTGLMLSFAFSYGGRKEIVDAANKFMSENPGKPLSEETLSNYLYRPEIGDVDLMIRTAGDQRISNFMLWESSYAELYFTSTKWPDFTSPELEQIIDSVSKRQRRFGAVIEDDRAVIGDDRGDKSDRGNNGDKTAVEGNFDLKAVSHGS